MIQLINAYKLLRIICHQILYKERYAFIVLSESSLGKMENFNIIVGLSNCTFFLFSDGWNFYLSEISHNGIFYIGDIDIFNLVEFL